MMSNREQTSSPGSMSRRSFLALTAAAAPLALSAPLSFGATARRVPVGIELYSVRDELAKDLPATVRAVARMGYEVVEFFSPAHLGARLFAHRSGLHEDRGLAR